MIKIPVYRNIVEIDRGIPPVVIYSFSAYLGKAKLFAYIENTDDSIEIVRRNENSILFSWSISSRVFTVNQLIHESVIEQYGFRLIRMDGEK